MSKTRAFVFLGGLLFAWFAASGCVAQDEHLRVDFARRQAIERAEQLERDLADERARANSLQTERDSLLREMDAKVALAETLQTENARLDELRMDLRAQLDAMLQAGVGDIQVVEVKLPPELDKALQDFAAQYPDMIEYDSKRGAVRWKSDLTFALGSDVVRNAVRPSLEAFAGIVNAAAAVPFEVVVVGHTDNVRISPGTAKKHPTNWHLSAHRAASVMFALNQNGVDYGRMGIMGYGEYRPRVSNPDRGGAEANRRVEIFLVASGETAPSMEAVTRTLKGGPDVARVDSE